MADQLMQRYETYVRVTRNFLAFIGLWSKSSWTITNSLKRFYTICGTFVVVAAMFNNIYHHSSDLNFVTDTLISAISAMGVGIKILGLLIQESALVKYHEILENSFEKDLHGPSLQSACLAKIDTFFVPMRCLTSLMILLIIFLSLMPIILMFYQIVSGFDPIIFILPYPTMYPWAVSDSLILFISTYIFETSIVIATACTSAGTDCLFGLYVFQMCGQFNAMSFRMTDLKITDDYANTLRDCVVGHHELIHRSHCLEEMYASIMLSIRITDAIVICSLLFQMNKFAEKGLTSVIIYGIFIFIKLVQQLMYGWYGSMLTSESEAFQQAVYSAEWSEIGDTKFMKNILVVLKQKPIQLSPYNLFKISIQMVTSVMNASVSYFFLLQTLDETNP